MHKLPQLNYKYNALEPYIDAQTMEIHHTKHHQAYVDKLNAVLEKYPDLKEQSVEYLLTNIDDLPVEEPDRMAIRNHGGGHINHSLFWQLMDPVNTENEELAKQIINKFGSVETFKEKFADIAVKHFGSGWAWLVRDGSGKLDIYSTPNQDSPFMLGNTPVIGLDIWEHAYYLKYKNKRPDYINAWWNVVKIIS